MILFNNFNNKLGLENESLKNNIIENKEIPVFLTFFLLMLF
jgi:hypothetical protein